MTLNLNAAVVPLLAAANSFAASQTISSGDLNLPATTSATSGVLYIGGLPFLHGYANGKANVFVGGAGNFTTTGISVTGAGHGALSSNTTGTGNTAAGAFALGNNTTGNDNTAVGYDAGPDLASQGLSNTTAIGFLSNVSQNNTLVLGNTTAGNPGASFVNVGIGTATPISTLEAAVADSGALGPAFTLTNYAGASAAGSAASIDFNTYTVPIRVGDLQPQ